MLTSVSFQGSSGIGGLVPSNGPWNQGVVLGQEQVYENEFFFYLQLVFSFSSVCWCTVLYVVSFSHLLIVDCAIFYVSTGSLGMGGFRLQSLTKSDFPMRTKQGSPVYPDYVGSWMWHVTKDQSQVVTTWWTHNSWVWLHEWNSNLLKPL